MSIISQPQSAPAMADAVTAKILLDTPALSPQLGFDGIAAALAEVIAGSEPRFAVGIFGGWGSGKTTLMRAIEGRLTQPNVVTVDFNAWRFEREPLLLVPLLDTLRAALVDWSAVQPETRGHVREVAGRVARVVRALASGLSGEVGLPGAAKVSFDVGAALAALRDPADPAQPQSLFVAAFRELAAALAELTAGGIDRVVVFVDDLDRCLADKALDVLESIKLFFDLPGFVFVVGLDKEAVERAVRAKFRAEATPLPTAATGGTSLGDDQPAGGSQVGPEYVKKIFQVPYTLPAVVFEDIDQLLTGMYAQSQLPQPQIEDFESRVRAYLRYITVDGRVNPREVKRFLNAYTLQTLVRPELDRATVLALQTLTFRYEWDEALSDVIFADPPLFAEALRGFREGDDQAFVDVAPQLAALPPELGEYLRSREAAAMAGQSDLGPYVSSLRTTDSRPSRFTEAYTKLVQLSRLARRVINEPDAGAVGDAPDPLGTVLNLAAEAERDLELVRRLATSAVSPSQQSGLTRVLEQGDDVVARLRSLTNNDQAREAIGRLQLVIADIYRELRRLRASPLSQS